jgi:O-methyltransferase
MELLMSLLDKFYKKTVVDRREEWEEFREQHPKLFASLYRGYQMYKSTRRRQHRAIYARFASFTRLSRQAYGDNLALCETVAHVPGAVVECGVWRGGMSAGMASVMGPERSYYLFDSFEGLPPADENERNHYGVSGKDWQATTPHNERAEITFAQEAMKLAGVPQVNIVKGWFKDTLPFYTGEPIAILRCDGDFYDSTMDTLTMLYDHVVPGGLIIFDDYYYWEGCARAVHAFLAQRQARETIRQFRGDYAYLGKR